MKEERPQMGADERAEERMAKMELPVFTQWPWPKIGRARRVPLRSRFLRGHDFGDPESESPSWDSGLG